ncbi:MAG: hypothetical protein R3C11_22445 [Planctomycetaceae bacterium]
MNIPTAVTEALRDPVYARETMEAEAALQRLGVNPSPAFVEFYNTYSGPFWSETLGSNSQTSPRMNRILNL